MREFSFKALFLGVVIGALLAMANTYVGLKVGMTVSASIPAAVISMAILRGIFRTGTILENNMVQTIGSAGESLAAGMIFTIPALLLMQYDVSYLDMLIWAAIGGILGVCLMVPLRRVLIVKEHETLPYPEGTACAEVLESGQEGGAGARKVFWGLGIGAIYEIARRLGAWKNNVDWPIVFQSTHYKTGFSLDASPALLGVGYILGFRVAGYILGGAMLGWFLIIPSIAYFGADNAAYAIPDGASFSDFITNDQVRHAYFDYADNLYSTYLKNIGAGAVAVGGLLSLLKSGRTIFGSIFGVLGSLFGAGRRRRDRTDRDMPMLILLVIAAGLVYAMWQFPQVRTGHIGAVVVLIAAFFFVTVSARLVGLVGASSNPISGMTIATLLGTSVVFLHYMGASPESKFAALSVGAIVCIAIGVAGDCSQDLKTGYLVKATPWKQQLGEMVGVLTSCAVIAFVIKLLAETYGFGDNTPLMAPQATLMKKIVEGVMDGNLPWFLILLGGAVALILELLFGLPALPVAVGLYLPLGLSTPIMVGGLLRAIVTKVRKPRPEAPATDGGVLTASGFVAAEGLVGVAMAGGTALIARFWNDPMFQSPVMAKAEFVKPDHLTPWVWERLGWQNWHDWRLEGWAYDLLPFVPFALLTLWLLMSGLRRIPITLAGHGATRSPGPPGTTGGAEGGAGLIDPADPAVEGDPTRPGGPSKTRFTMLPRDDASSEESDSPD